MSDFAKTRIDINYFTNLWGPYAFRFPICSSATANDGKIPYGDTIDAVEVKAYEGVVTDESDLADAIEIEDLIDPDFTPFVSGGDTISLKLQYPSDPADLKGTRATLVFELTLTSGGTKAFYFPYIYIK